MSESQGRLFENTPDQRPVSPVPAGNDGHYELRQWALAHPQLVQAKIVLDLIAENERLETEAAAHEIILSRFLVTGSSEIERLKGEIQRLTGGQS